MELGLPWLKNGRPRDFIITGLLLVICGLLYYAGELATLAGWTNVHFRLSYTVHDLHRLLFLAPIVYSGYMLRIKGSLIVTFIAAIVMLPRALIISPYPDPVIRLIVFLFMTGMVGILVGMMRNWIEMNSRLFDQQLLLAGRVKASQQKYRDIFQKASDAIWIADMSGNIISANNAALAFKDFKVEELAHTYRDTILTEKSLHKANEIRRNLLGGIAVQQPYEQILVTHKGNEIILMVTASVVYEGEKPVGFEYIARDITQERSETARRMALEKKVRLERDKLFGILENMQDGVFIVGSDYRIRFMNTSMIRQFGPGIGLYCYEHLAMRKSPCRDICGMGTVLLGDTIRWEYSLSDGTIFEVSASPFMDSDGLRCQLAALRNITQRKQLENELVKLNQLKSDLLSNVSHELKTPLTSIKGIISSLLQKDIQWDEATMEMLLNGMSEETDRLTSLVTNLLTMSKIESGVWQPELICCDIFDTIIEAVESQKWIHRNRTYEENMEVGLPKVWADCNQIRQVVNNLLENASAYSADDTRIRIAARKINGMIEISVEDQGTGIPAAEVEKIFEKFYRGSYRRRSPGGTGLGLAISKAIVEKHGGRIWVESEAGHGSTFRFTLSLCDNSD